MREFDRGTYGVSATGWRYTLCRALALIGFGAALSGCALTIPMSGAATDFTPTGSIKPASNSPFSSEMDGEDWRRAKSALDTALDPQGNGASVSWSNPQSGAKGTFTPLAQPYPKDDGICRVFRALLATKNAHDRTLRSSACRRNGGEWIVGDVHADENANLATKTSHNLVESDKNSHLKRL